MSQRFPCPINRTETEILTPLSSHNIEPFKPLIQHDSTLLLIQRKPARIVQLLARFAGDVGAHVLSIGVSHCLVMFVKFEFEWWIRWEKRGMKARYASMIYSETKTDGAREGGDETGETYPAIRAREQRLIAQLRHILAPLLLRLCRRLDRTDTLFAHFGDGVDDPAALHFDAGGAVAEGCGALWRVSLGIVLGHWENYLSAVEEEHVGVAGAGHAEVGPGARSPFLSQGDAINVEEPHVFHAAGDRVEAGGEGDEVDFMEGAVGGEDAFGFDLDDGVGFDIDDVDVGVVELLVEVLFERGALGAEGVRGLEGG